jgi:DNA polymerase-3 subunit epsilon
MAARIAIVMAKQNKCDSLDELLKKLEISIGRLEPDGWEGCRSKYASSSSRFNHEINVKEIVVNIEADQSHHVYGKRIVFTGELSSMTRVEAWKMIGALGGVPQRGITRETNLLVMGDQDLGVLRVGETRSAKFREAEKRKGDGQNIEVMSEVDFLAYLEPESGSFH